MRPTRWWTLLAIVVIITALTWALLGAIYASLPPLPWTVAPALVIAAGAEAWSGYDLRARLRGKRAGKPVQPLQAARLLALAKASSQAGALFGGIFLGFVGYTSGSLSFATPRQDLIVASVTFGACLILIAAALYLEYCCRVPGGDGGDEGQRQPGEGSPRGGPHSNR